MEKATHQRLIGYQRGEAYTQRGQQQARDADQRCRAIADQTFAQPQDRAERRSGPHRDQPDGCGLHDREVQAEDQQRHRENAAARTGERQDQSDHRAECQRGETEKADFHPDPALRWSSRAAPATRGL